MVVEVAHFLPNEATITEAEPMEAAKVAEGTNCLTRTGKIQVDLDVNLVEEWKKRGQTCKR